MIFRLGYLTMYILSVCSLFLYHMHMFQLNSYSCIEENRFLRTNFYPLLGRYLGIVFSFVIILALPLKVSFAVCILLNFMTFLGNRGAAGGKIGLKFTGRVKRMSLTAAVLYIAAMAVFFTFAKFYSKAGIFLAQGFTLFIPFLIMLSNVLNSPIEKHINQRFINEAKHIINSMDNLTVIGITGSYGKTSMKNMVAALLSEDFYTLMTPGNYNTTLGVVITVREKLSPLHQVFVCEMGAKGVGEIKEICDIVKPDIGILTAIGPMHLESFGSMANIEKGKFELIDALPEGGSAVLNFDNEIIKNHKVTGRKLISYAADCEADFHPINIVSTSKGSEFDMKFPDSDKLFHFTIGLLGRHNVLNMAGAAAAAYIMGVKPEKIAALASGIKPVEHRLELKEAPFGLMIDDAYNSNPRGANEALAVLAGFENMARVLVTPGMVELGAQDSRIHYEYGKAAAQSADYIVLVGRQKTADIKKGALEAGFPSENLRSVNNIDEAFAFLNSLNVKLPKIALFENDLPDNY